MSASSFSPWRGPGMIIGIALLTIVPMLLAWYYASHPELITRRTNYGRLIVPPEPLDYGRLNLKPQSPAPFDDMKGRWLLVQVGWDGCGAACTATLHKTHQSRLMMNKEISRIRRVLLLPEDRAGWNPDTEDQKDESLLIATFTTDIREKMARVAGNALREDALFLVDPLGNLILYYEPEFDPYGLVKDLRHLLKVSQIG